MALLSNIVGKKPNVMVSNMKVILGPNIKVGTN
jgi:hypothetical protein